MIKHPCPIVFATEGPAHHFFGYYDKSPVDDSSQHMLSHRASFDFKRMPKRNDVVEVGYWNIESRRYTGVATTRAWNWQQGSQLQWLGSDFGSRIIFNDIKNNAPVSRIIDVQNGNNRTLPLPVYTVSPDGRYAICVNYHRLSWTHIGYHYEMPKRQRWAGELPEGDGLFCMNLENGKFVLIIETRALTEYEPVGSMSGAVHYIEHAMFDPEGKRFHFLHRWNLPDGGIYSRLFTANRDGSELRCLHDSGYVSHCGWRGMGEIVGYARPRSKITSLRRSRFLSKYVINPLLPIYHQVLKRIPKARERLIGDSYLCFLDSNPSIVGPLTNNLFPGDGHCTFRHGDTRWMITDTYEDDQDYRHLLIYDTLRDELIEIGRFYSLPETNSTGFRADLHPRWCFGGSLVCIDSTHKGDRQMYLVDVAAVLES